MCGMTASARHSESERVLTRPARVVHDASVDSGDAITNDDIAAAKRLWVTALEQGAPRDEVAASHRWYDSLIAGQARQLREDFQRRLGLPARAADAD